jgi:hypothetical protein
MYLSCKLKPFVGGLSLRNNYIYVRESDELPHCPPWSQESASNQKAETRPRNKLILVPEKRNQPLLMIRSPSPVDISARLIKSQLTLFKPGYLLGRSYTGHA